MLGAEEQVKQPVETETDIPSVPPTSLRPQQTYSTMKIFRSW